MPELARFLRPQGGLINTFLSTQLAGALQLQGDQWIATSGGAGGSTAIAFDPAFLKAINTLQQVAGHLLAQGEPQYVFSLKPVPTPGVTDTLLTLDGQALHYYNQVETWSPMTWPSSEPQKAGTRLEWQSAHREIMALLRFYLGYESEADLEMHVRPELMPPPTLETRQTSLGYTVQLEAPARSASGVQARVTRVQLGRWNGAAGAHA